MPFSRHVPSMLEDFNIHACSLNAAAIHRLVSVITQSDQLMAVSMPADPKAPCIHVHLHVYVNMNKCKRRLRHVLTYELRPNTKSKLKPRHKYQHGPESQTDVREATCATKTDARANIGKGRDLYWERDRLARRHVHAGKLKQLSDFARVVVTSLGSCCRF